jgi:hypothetical protein
VHFPQGCPRAAFFCDGVLSDPQSDPLHKAQGFKLNKTDILNTDHKGAIIFEQK